MTPVHQSILQGFNGLDQEGKKKNVTNTNPISKFYVSPTEQS